MAIDKKPIDQQLTEYKKPEDIIGKTICSKSGPEPFWNERSKAEMSDHLG